MDAEQYFSMAGRQSQDGGAVFAEKTSVRRGPFPPESILEKIGFYVKKL